MKMPISHKKLTPTIATISTVALLFSAIFTPLAEAATDWRTGSWAGEGSHTRAELELIGCNDRRCFFRLLFYVGESGVLYSRKEGRVTFPENKVIFDEPLQQFSPVMKIRIEEAGKRVVFEFVRCVESCGNNFLNYPDEYDLKKTSAFPSFSPSFDCAKAVTKYEEWACRNDRMARFDKDLNFQFQEYLTFIPDPKAKNAFREEQLRWHKDFMRTCETTNDSICEEKIQARITALREEKKAKGSCQSPTSFFQSVLCEDSPLSSRIKKWNDTVQHIERQEKEGKSLHSRAGFHPHSLMEMDCEGLSVDEVKACLTEKLDRFENGLNKTAISTDDWRWMATWEGMDTNDLIWDNAGFSFLTRLLPPSIRDEIALGLTGPPSNIVVRNENVWVQGCVAHACNHKSFVWIDIKQKVVIGGLGTSPMSDSGCGGESPVTLGSTQLSPEQIRHQHDFQQAFSVWGNGLCGSDNPTFIRE